MRIFACYSGLSPVSFFFPVGTEIPTVSGFIEIGEVRNR